MAHHALVFGASGILGWAVVNEILSNYPEKGTYAKVTALTNRPLSYEDALWPTPGPDTPEVNLVSGIDLTHGTTETFDKTLKEKVPDIGTVDHVFYFAYKFHPHFPTESSINLQMLQRGFDALEALAPNMSYVIFPTGTKGYGIHLPQRPFKAPFDESMNTLPSPSREELFYYVLRDELTQRQSGKLWSWAELRSDMVVGFVPHPNPYNLAGTLGNYLSLYKFMHERAHPHALSHTVPYPSPEPSFRILNNEGNSAIFARAALHLCLHPHRTGNAQLYNLGGETAPDAYGDRWPDMATVFGLEGGGPVERGLSSGAVGFVKEHADMVEAMRQETGTELQVVENEEGFDAWMALFDFDHHFELGKLRGTGFKEEMRAGELWRGVFEKYAQAGRHYLGRGKVASTAV